jgi:5-(carboxyamino)imidazole ribonucleotide mutase
MAKNKVAVIMGSISDADIMQKAVSVLQHYKVDYEFMVVSAHRSPEWMYQYASEADKKNIKVIIAGAGGAAHLPGMVAALTTVPVIGVPIKSSNSLDGWDSLLSIAQMPNDIPVATVAVNGAHNAGMLAVEMLAISDARLKKLLANTKKENNLKVQKQNEELKKNYK